MGISPSRSRSNNIYKRDVPSLVPSVLYTSRILSSKARVTLLSMRGPGIPCTNYTNSWPAQIFFQRFMAHIIFVNANESMGRLCRSLLPNEGTVSTSMWYSNSQPHALMTIECEWTHHQGNSGDQLLNCRHHNNLTVHHPRSWLLSKDCKNDSVSTVNICGSMLRYVSGNCRRSHVS